MTNSPHIQFDRMIAWACVNAILSYCDEPEAVFGEWRRAMEGETSGVDPVIIAKRVQKLRVATKARS